MKNVLSLRGKASKVQVLVSIMYQAGAGTGRIAVSRIFKLNSHSHS